MTVPELLASARPKMEGAFSHLAEELKTLRTGRASAQMLDGVVVSYYGTQTPLKALATINAPEPSQILIQPFDAGAIKSIRDAITEADMGFNPSDDGRVLRISVPPLTGERREELVKKAGKMLEAAKIAVRNIRGEVWEHIQKLQKDGEISEDLRDQGRGDVDELTAEFNKKLEVASKEKEADIRTV